jgi:hypothetical protein
MKSDNLDMRVVGEIFRRYHKDTKKFVKQSRAVNTRFSAIFFSLGNNAGQIMADLLASCQHLERNDFAKLELLVTAFFDGFNLGMHELTERYKGTVEGNGNDSR